MIFHRWFILSESIHKLAICVMSILTEGHNPFFGTYQQLGYIKQVRTVLKVDVLEDGKMGKNLSIGPDCDG